MLHHAPYPDRRHPRDPTAETEAFVTSPSWSDRWENFMEGLRDRDFFKWTVRNTPGRRARWGNLRRLEPLSETFGWDRGTPIDRVYIEQFLSSHAADIDGRVLEVKDARYTERFGAGATRSEERR